MSLSLLYLWRIRMNMAQMFTQNVCCVHTIYFCVKYQVHNFTRMCFCSRSTSLTYIRWNWNNFEGYLQHITCSQFKSSFDFFLLLMSSQYVYYTQKPLKINLEQMFILLQRTCCIHTICLFAQGQFSNLMQLLLCVYFILLLYVDKFWNNLIECSS